MSHVVIVVSDPNSSIEQLNAKLQNTSGSDKSSLINLAIDYLASALVGNVVAGSVQVTTRDTDPGVATSGANSQQASVIVG